MSHGLLSETIFSSTRKKQKFYAHKQKTKRTYCPVHKKSKIFSFYIVIISTSNKILVLQLLIEFLYTFITKVLSSLKRFLVECTSLLEFTSRATLYANRNPFNQVARLFRTRMQVFRKTWVAGNSLMILPWARYTIHLLRLHSTFHP